MKNLTITPPEGYEIDKEQSTFENIVFKPLIKLLPKKWRDLDYISGYSTDLYSNTHLINSVETCVSNSNVFATLKQAEACIALAQLSQLMAVYNDGWVPDWTNMDYKYIIYFSGDNICTSFYLHAKHFLAFKTKDLGDEFIENFRDLIITARPLL
jgi:hypothetical protein